ncbi:hypothetical protein G5V58_18825 [Nocardioides anomalus]|uniref:HEAT repeat domain-containing protein n=1 Tax=Nocardioides anomalus TaxID=2712223 RepID=A0A6G6WHD7_9ACTN|nr:DUF6000 family protein [Nocardioides anomalus]QIG44563.1 hypothetical protein G5V58_18825 [Nocardioides anomalus]
MPGHGSPELDAAVARYVVPERRYLRLLHGAFLDDADADAFVQALRSDAARVSDDELDLLLGHEWRARLTAAWLVAADRRAAYVDPLGGHLLRDESTYAGQGYCVALAAVGGAPARGHLLAYLERLRSLSDVRSDREWALAALLVADRRDGSTDAGPFVTGDGRAEPLGERVAHLERLLAHLEG